MKSGEKMNLFLKYRMKITETQQLNQYECGISCFKMILSYYKYEISINNLRKHFDNNVNGITMLEFKKVAFKFNLKSSVKKVDASQLLSVRNIVPMIIFWNNNHYVVLEKIKKDSCIIVDPSAGRREVSEAEFIEKFSNYIMLLEPDENFQQHREKSTIKRYFNNVLRYKKLMFLIFGVAILLQFIAISIPVLIQNIVDYIIIDAKYDVNVILILTICVILLQVAISYLKNYLMIQFQKKLDYTLMSNFVNHMIKLPYKFFQLRTRGDLIQRLNSNAIIRDIFLQKFMTSFINVLLIIVLFVYMFMQSKFVALGVLGLGILQISVLLLNKKKMQNLTQKQVMTQVKSNSFLTEMVNGIETIKVLGIEDEIGQSWNNILNEQIDKATEKSLFRTKIDITINSIIFFAPLFIVILSINEILKGNMTIGQLLAFQTLTMAFLNPINSLALVINDITMLTVLLERIYDVIDEKVEREGEIKVDTKFKGDIKLKNVSFKYNEYGKNIIKNISLDINVGEKVAIVGKSGSGKSTLAMLFTGMYEATEGEILFDNINLKKFNKNIIRHNIGAVLQESFLFNKTIRENIDVNNKVGDIEKIIEVCKIAKIHDDIMELPMGYETLLTESATNLSGGQKQRVAIARAIINKPAILLLDEATSGLDSIVEKDISDNIYSLNCTQIIIAHRLSTIINADKIIVLEDGNIVDMGTHDELIEKCEIYMGLYDNRIGVTSK